MGGMFWHFGILGIWPFGDFGRVCDLQACKAAGEIQKYQAPSRVGTGQSAMPPSHAQVERRLLNGPGAKYAGLPHPVVASAFWFRGISSAVLDLGVSGLLDIGLFWAEFLEMGCFRYFGNRLFGILGLFGRFRRFAYPRNAPKLGKGRRKTAR